MERKLLRWAAVPVIEFSGAAEEQARSQRDLLVHALQAGIGIVIL
jgi:hypothetical protein